MHQRSCRDHTLHWQQRGPVTRHQLPAPGGLCASLSLNLPKPAKSGPKVAGSPHGCMADDGHAHGLVCLMVHSLASGRAPGSNPPAPCLSNPCGKGWEGAVPQLGLGQPVGGPSNQTGPVQLGQPKWHPEDIIPGTLYPTTQQQFSGPIQATCPDQRVSWPWLAPHSPVTFKVTHQSPTMLTICGGLWLEAHDTCTPLAPRAGRGLIPQPLGRTLACWLATPAQQGPALGEGAGAPGTECPGGCLGHWGALWGQAAPCQAGALTGTSLSQQASKQTPQGSTHLRPSPSASGLGQPHHSAGAGEAFPHKSSMPSGRKAAQ